MFRKSLTIVTAVAVLAVLPSVAGAHVTLQPTSAPAGKFTRFDVRVPNERDEPTTKVDVRFPDGFVFASYEPVPGWKVTIRREKLDKPVTAEGETFSEQVSRITWTGDGERGSIGPGQFQDFGLSVQVPDKPGTKLTFPALQTYQGGDVVRWIGAEGSDEPAARVEVTAAEPDDHGAGSDGASGATGADGAADDPSGSAAGQEPAEETSAGNGGGEDSNTLSIIALVVGGLGLVSGGLALRSARRSQ